MSTKGKRLSRPDVVVGQFYRQPSEVGPDLIVRITETATDWVIYRITQESGKGKSRKLGRCYPMKTASLYGYSFVATLDVDAAAGRLGVAPSDVTLMASRGGLAGFRDGDEWHIPVDTITEIEERNTALDAAAKQRALVTKPLFPDTPTVGPTLTPDAIQEIAGLVALDLTTGTLAEQIAGAVTKVLSAPAYMESLATMVTKKLGRLGLKVDEESEFERLSKRVVNPKGALYPETDEVMVNGTAKH